MPEGRHLAESDQPDILVGSEATIAKFAHSLPIGFLIVDEYGRIAFANAELEKMTGFADGSLCGAGVDDLVPTRFRDDHAAARRRYQMAPSSRSMGEGRDLFARRADGSEFPVEVGLRPAIYGSRRATMATIIDVSARRELESAFRSIFESAPYGLLLVDPSGRIDLANRQITAMFGYHVDELIGQPIEILLPHRARAAHVGKRDGFFAKPEERMMGRGRDLTGRRKDGIEFPLEIGLSSIASNRGRMVCASVVDITQRKRAELKLKDANAQLEEFTHVASHDLKSPIRGIAGLLEFIQEDYGTDLPDGLRHNLDRIGERVERMEKLIEELLTYAHAGRRTLKLDTVDMADVINDVLAMEITAKRIQVSKHATREPFEAALTPLTTVIRNLVSNAVKHHDREDIRLDIAATMEGDYCVIDVSDDGPGVPEAQQSRIFRLFQTLATTETKSSGLGLALVQRLVEGHGGKVQLFSTDGKRGSTFRVWWPRFARTDLDVTTY